MTAPATNVVRGRRSSRCSPGRGSPEAYAVRPVGATGVLYCGTLTVRSENWHSTGPGVGGAASGGLTGPMVGTGAAGCPPDPAGSGVLAGVAVRLYGGGTTVGATREPPVGVGAAGGVGGAAGLCRRRHWRGCGRSRRDGGWRRLDLPHHG